MAENADDILDGNVDPETGEWDEDYLDLGDPETCPECDGAGFIVTCCDDICVARGECMHGDGEETCPECNGGGEV